MITDQQKYYEAYEDRYQRVYAQGVEYWMGDPDQIATVIGLVDGFLEFAGATPISPRSLSSGVAKEPSLSTFFRTDTHIWG